MTLLKAPGRYPTPFTGRSAVETDNYATISFRQRRDPLNKIIDHPEVCWRHLASSL